MSTDTRAVLDMMVREAISLRFDTKLPVYPAAAPLVLEALLEVRSRLDRVEELLGQVVRMRSRVAERANLATATVGDAWDSEATRMRQAPVSMGEYSSAKERAAEANLAVLDLRREQRSAAELLAACESARDVIRLSHSGLEGLRHDLRTWLHALSFESHLDRS